MLLFPNARGAAPICRAVLWPLLILQAASAAPSASTLKACSEIAGRLPGGRVSYPLQLSYVAETQRYWSLALRELHPACIVSPQNADQVAAAVQVLAGHADVPFTVKSGGHDPNPGHSSIDDGVLIAMREMVGATYDAASGHALVRPAGEWNDVLGDLEPYGVTVVGGRLGIVGVGGLLLQGGLSFLTAQYGLAADSIVGWETVMPNGSVVNIDAKAQPDLAVAMKGSGGQFGIVTQFTIEAHPIGQVWGGVRLYDESKKDKLYAALHNFVPNNADDPKSAVIFTDLAILQNGTAAVVFYFHEGPDKPTSGPLMPFLDVPPLIDITRTQSYPQLLKANGVFSSAAVARDSFRTFTIPYIPSNPGLYDEISKKWRDITSAYLTILHPTAQCSVDFQPLPGVVGQRTEARGGNAMGLTAADPNRIVLELQCGWLNGRDDAILYALSRDMTNWLQSRMPEWLAQAGLGEEAYMPLFMNDAAGDQNVTGSYRGYAEFKKLQENVDPMGMFAKRAGGYKY
ncbi:6-hydroxy-d-nicotine oxidase [Apiospora kogelbergensis]|uniref:6-hydroxy-d-nicotine oxidase n=1 Tax=Apiospora kogelbergensis TaxID=1337665 RepID=UPI0031327149